MCPVIPDPKLFTTRRIPIHIQKQLDTFHKKYIIGKRRARSSKDHFGKATTTTTKIKNKSMEL